MTVNVKGDRTGVRVDGGAGAYERGEHFADGGVFDQEFARGCEPAR